MEIERLKKKYGVNKPIFTEEILQEYKEYSRPRIFRLLQSALDSGEIVRFDKGVYYIPTETIIGKSAITVDSVVRKKYISDGDNVYGIYGKLILQLNFLLSYQVPNSIEVITNFETMRKRIVQIGGRNIVLRKSRCPINADNAAAYTLMELFSDIDLTKYADDDAVKREVYNYIKANSVTRKDLTKLAGVFPAKTIKNLLESGILYEIA